MASLKQNKINMSETKLITVFGATGCQGGSVAKALLADGGFSVRGVTRNKQSDKAKALQEAGAQIVEADMTNKDQVEAAVKGSWGVFLVTQFFEKFSAEDEEKQGRTVVDAVKAADSVEFMVFSSLESSLKVSDGKFNAPHFESKARVQQYIEELDIPCAFVRVGMYFENMIPSESSPFTKRMDDGRDGYKFAVPIGSTPLAGIAAMKDVGPAVVSLFKNHNSVQGQTFGLAGYKAPFSEWIKVFQEVTGKEAEHVDYPPGEDFLGQMFGLMQEFPPDRSPEKTRELHSDVMSWKQWLEEHKQFF